MRPPVKAIFVQRAATATSRVLLALIPLGLGTCVDQPKVNCLTSTNPFAVKLIEQSRSGACDDFGPDSFNAVPVVGLSPYYAKNSKGQPDYDIGSVAIQSTEIGTLATTAADYDVENSASDAQLYSFGPFTVKEPNDENFCPAPKLSPAHLVLDELPAVEDDPETEADDSFAGQPAVDIKLEWSNLEVYVTAAILGTQFKADLTDTRVTPDGDTCTIKYRALGLAPAVSCAKMDDDGIPVVGDDGKVELDPPACDPEANPAMGRFVASGISIGTDYVCDPVLAYCVVAGETVPALQ